LDLWLDKTNAKDEILVYYAAAPAFMYYANLKGLDYASAEIKNSSYGFSETHSYKNIHYSESVRERDTDYVKEVIVEAFDNTMPNNTWFIASHIRENDYAQYLAALDEMGYGYQVYRWQDARLLWFFDSSYIENNYRQIADVTDFAKIVVGSGQAEHSVGENEVDVFRYESHDLELLLELTGEAGGEAAQPTHILVEFSSDFAGYLSLGYRFDEASEFIAENSVTAQFVAGHKRIMLEIPENIRWDSLKLDIHNTEAAPDTESIVTMHRFMVLGAV
jgi:hypothetical protein